MKTHAVIAIDRLLEIIDLAANPDGGLTDFGPNFLGPIRCEHVGFQPCGRAPILADVSLVAAPGRFTILTGASGCGKSTLLGLLQRLHPPTTGRICVGGHDIARFRLESLRRHLAVVPQHTRFRSGTVLENLTPGDPAPDVPRLLQLCQDAGVLAFIEQLPHGFLTSLPEDGATLAGGQRQRFALVRALYRDAPVLLLDEPAAALDATGEAELLPLVLRERDRGRIVIAASHSPAIIAAADEIIKLDPPPPRRSSAPLAFA